MSIIDISSSRLYSFFACLLFSSHHLCVLSSDYSAKPCLKKIIEFLRVQMLLFFFSTFLCLPLFTPHTHTNIYAWLSHIIFYLFVFYINIFFSACILYECLVFFCVSLFFFFEENDRTFFFLLSISTDVILCMISNID